MYLQRWENVASTVHTAAAVQLTADKTKPTTSNRTLQSEKRALGAKAQGLYYMVSAEVTERDHLPRKLQEAGAA